MRCFVAIELSPEVHRQLAALQQRLASSTRGVRWVASEGIHLTIKFLGEVPDRRIPEICRAVNEAAGRSQPFEFVVRSTGCFPPHGGVRVVWGGLDEPTGRLAACQQSCEDAFFQLGFARENRPFVPHLTLGRVKDPHQARGLRQTITSCANFEAGTVSARELVLFESRLSPHGSTYVPVSRAVFGGG